MYMWPPQGKNKLALLRMSANQDDYAPCRTTSLWKGVWVSTKGVCSSHPLGFDLRSFASGFGCTIKGSRRFFLCFFSRIAFCKRKKDYEVGMNSHTHQGIAAWCQAVGNKVFYIGTTVKSEKLWCSLLRVSHFRMIPGCRVHWWLWREALTWTLGCHCWQPGVRAPFKTMT